MAALSRAASSDMMRVYFRAYLHMLTGWSGRLVLQAVYFAVLINALSLADYGVFASALAAAMIIGPSGELGFVAPAFRAATARPRVIGAYMTATYAYALMSLPLTALLIVGAHALLFSGHLAFTAFAAIVFAEAFLIRLTDSIIQVNVGLNRYRLSSMLLLINPLARAGAVVVFWLFGDGTLEQWALFFLGGSVASLALIAPFAPRARLRWHSNVFFGRLKEALSYEAMCLSIAVQSEADKILMLMLTSQEVAGLYALTMRVIDLIGVPVRSFHRIYAQMLIRRPEWLTNFTQAISVEAAMGIATTIIFAAFLGALSFHPTLLGQNVATGYAWFAGLLIVPAGKMLTDFHREILFAARRLVTSAAISSVLTVVRLGGLALIVYALPDHDDWIWPLDALFAGLYAISLVLVWSWGLRPAWSGASPSTPVSQPV